MPRQVDHDGRRRRVAQAVWELISRDGLEAATLREVATQAELQFTQPMPAAVMGCSHAVEVAVRQAASLATAIRYA